MPTLIDRRGPRVDVWTRVADADTGEDAANRPAAAGTASLPAATPLLLSLPRWRLDGPSLVAAGRSVGVRLAPGDDPAEIAPALGQLALIAIEFPTFADGRGYSSARLLRQRHGWTGELRAIGDVQRDQLFYLARCGFDTFLLRDGESVANALLAFGDFSDAYQGGADCGPLFGRRAAAVS